MAAVLALGPMSALGQKQTFAPQKAMSALHPKADICSAVADVRYGPKADILRVGQAPAYREARWRGQRAHNLNSTCR